MLNQYKLLLEYIKNDCKQNNIKLYISKDQYVSEYKKDINKSAGYFSSTKRELAVGTCKTNKATIMTVIHEYSHMCQFLDKNFNWKKYIKSNTIYYEWLYKNIELDKYKLKEVIQDVIYLELDCEQRSVNLIDEFNLNLSKEMYIKYANLNLYLILYSSRKRQYFNKINNTIHIVEQIKSILKPSYKYIPKAISELLEYNTRLI